MEPARAQFLTTPAAANALASISPAVRQLPLSARVAALRRDWPPEQAAAISEQLDLQERAQERFGDHADAMRFTAEGLEMATHPTVAARRAQRLATLDLPVFDLGSGLGSESLALARAGARPLALERDPATALLAAYNLAGAGDVIRGDVRQLPFDVSDSAVVLDPSRRSARGRRFDPAAFEPPWDTCLELAALSRAAAIKGPPGIDHAAVPPAAELEFVQLGRDLREAAVYLGVGAEAGMRRAVLLPSGACLQSDEPAIVELAPAVAGFIGDPESCVTRAGLVQQAAHRASARMLDQSVAYLTAGSPVASPFVRWFEVLDVMPFAVKGLRARLRKAGWRPVEIRRRAFPVEPDELRRLLGRLDGDPVVLLCTTIAGQRTVVVARPAALFAETV